MSILSLLNPWNWRTPVTPVARVLRAQGHPSGSIRRANDLVKRWTNRGYIGDHLKRKLSPYRQYVTASALEHQSAFCNSYETHREHLEPMLNVVSRVFSQTNLYEWALVQPTYDGKCFFLERGYKLTSGVSARQYDLDICWGLSDELQDQQFLIEVAREVRQAIEHQTVKTLVEEASTRSVCYRNALLKQLQNTADFMFEHSAVRPDWIIIHPDNLELLKDDIRDWRFNKNLAEQEIVYRGHYGHFKVFEDPSINHDNVLMGSSKQPGFIYSPAVPVFLKGNRLVTRCGVRIYHPGLYGVIKVTADKW